MHVPVYRPITMLTTFKSVGIKLVKVLKNQVPVDVVGNERNVEHQCEILISKEKENVEEYVDGILW